jgi:hypothetical protein
VWPASHITLGGQPRVGTILKTVLSTCPKEAVLKVSNAQRWCKEETWQPGQVAWPASLTSGPHAPNLWPQHRLTPPINTMVLPPAERVKRVRFSPLECSQDHSCRVESRERRGSEGWRTSRLVRSPRNSSGSMEFSELWFDRVRKLYQNSANSDKEPTLESLWCI